MSGEILITADGVSKKFSTRLKSSMKYGIMDIGRDFMGISTKSENLRSNEFWGVQDVNFEVRRGECIGLIGPNGSGKSTLLKMLNGILVPDKGSIRINGRVGALIEIGAGFHPLLSGKENIYINGAILGFSKAEIDEKFESIVDFSEIKDFINTPVAYYSSGMYVRLGFAVAIHLKPDILLIDEVLAVGDVGFRSKCYSAVSDIMKNAAVIFVSHLMPAITRTCTRVIVLEKGRICYNGDKVKGINHYNSLFPKISSSILGTGEAQIFDLKILNKDNQETNVINFQETLNITFKLTISKDYKKCIISLSFANMEMSLIAQCHSMYNNIEIDNDGAEKTIWVSIPNVFLNPGKYYLNIIIFDEENTKHLCWHYAEKVITILGEFVGSAPAQFVGKWEISH